MSQHNCALPALEVETSDLPVSTTATEVVNATPAPLLVSRKNACQLLGDVHASTLCRMEKAGRLSPVRLHHSRTAPVFYRMSDVLRIVNGE